MTNDQANYYLGIPSITVNGKNTYELKGKFLDDLHKNAFSGTNGEDAVKHIEYFLKIVNLIDLLNVNQDKLRAVVSPISLNGDAWRCDKIKPTNDETSDLEETDHDDEQEIDEIFRIETNLFDYETPMTIGFTNGTMMCHGYTKNHGRIIEHGMNPHQLHIVANLSIIKLDVRSGLHDYEWYEALEDGELKEEALRNKVIMEGTIDDDDEQEICSNETHELPVCNIRRFEMIKYSFGDDEEYVAIKEDEYDDLTSTSKDACRSYQEIFRIMDEGWMVTRDE
uniref:MAK10-like protein n=1 Tax=Tanacetum cinerariifolium TaxID=118510 RepID=A0A699GXA2_TANCI|nr:hypothetical protein [Tanacetum cinerariifolium]